MDLQEYIKIALIKKKLNERQLAIIMNESPQNINRKLKSDMKISFLTSVANAMNCDVDITFIDRESKKPLL